MRTTITFDPDVAADLVALQAERGLSFTEAVNDTLLRGFGMPLGGGSYTMPVGELGVRVGVDVDRIRDQLGLLDDRRL